MSNTRESPLLWVNKDATNFHRKKHVAEVNAHVQKSSLKKSRPRKSSSHNKQILPLRKPPSSESRFPSPGSTSNTSTSSGDDNHFNLKWNTFKSRSNTLDSTRNDGIFGDLRAEPVDIVESHFPDYKEQPTAALIFSSYREEGVLTFTSDIVSENQDLLSQSRIIEVAQISTSSIPASLDASSPLPGFLADLSSHDKMLVHTHLTYMPQMYYGMTSQSTYCPIRTASVANMIKTPVAVLWVLLSMDMFLETTRKSSARMGIILQRKNHAYQLMAKAFEDDSRTNDPIVLLGPAAAAIAETFCGDPVKALTHLNGIDAFIEARGGLEYVQQMELTISMPIFAVSAYRTLLQDNLNTLSGFERARTSFMRTMFSLLTWNVQVSTNRASRSPETPHILSNDEGFDGDYDLTEGLLTLQMARERAFIHNPLVRKWVGPEYETDKAGEKVDHFIILYNLNRVLADHGTRIKQVTNIINEIVTDIETSGSSTGVNSSIKISGVLRLVTNRQARMHPHQPSAGVARAWEALDALEIMKLLSLDTQRKVRRTLHSLLCGNAASAMDQKDLDMLNSDMTAEWMKRHPELSALPG